MRCSLIVLFSTIVLFVVAFHSASFAGGKSGSKSLPVNRWREIKRFDKDSTEIPFYDTMFVRIKPKQVFSYHNKDAFVYNGTYTLEDKELDFGYAKFHILLKKPTRMEFQDAKGYYLFAIDSSDTLRTIVLPKPEVIDTNFVLDKMIGHWTAYKRMAIKPLQSVDRTTQIKTVIITGPSTGGKIGFVFSDADKADEPSWSILSVDGSANFQCEGKSKRSIKIEKCQGGEMILEDDGIRYYFKQFK